MVIKARKRHFFLIVQEASHRGVNDWLIKSVGEAAV